MSEWKILELRSLNPDSDFYEQHRVRMDGERAIDEHGRVIAEREPTGRWNRDGSPLWGKLTEIGEL